MRPTTRRSVPKLTGMQPVVKQMPAGPVAGAREWTDVSVDEAIRRLRADPSWADLVRDAYLGRDVADSARRFSASGEFQEVKAILADLLQGGAVLDIGAGTGIASAALLSAGARRVVALEPDPSDEVGRGAIARLDPEMRIEVVDGFGEAIPFPSEAFDVVYVRQLLHHAEDLQQLVSECARVLRTGGVLMACREHVVDNEAQLAAFLATHPVHRLAGGENAYSLPEYLAAISNAGLRLDRVFGPLDSVINAFPMARSREDLDAAPRRALQRRFGLAGALAGHVPGVQSLVAARMRRSAQSVPGRLYSFVASKPAG